MAKGREKHQARLDAIQMFGKDLARRAGRRCELCEESDDLRIYDADPEAEPDMDTLALLCGRCREVLEGRKADPSTLRFLEGAIWSDVAPIGGLAQRMIRRVDADWAREALALLPEEPGEG